jgi:NAD(P)-dependent dehydrogenase (short-subunit alcohol dehydrogenase family)
VHTIPPRLRQNIFRSVRASCHKRKRECRASAPVIAFLASDDAGWITGETIHVNGGQRG